MAVSDRTAVASLIATTFAFGTEAPAGSVTVPWSVAVDCAFAEHTTPRRSTNKNRA